MTRPTKLFGTDGIRGIANRFPMTPVLALRLGQAVTFLASRDSPTHRIRVVIGKDTRLSGYMLETALASGICSMGGHVLLSGPLPTPGVAHLTTSMRAHAGIVISASHNPFDDNGIKIFGKDGYKLPDEREEELERLVEDASFLDGARATGADIGGASRLEDATGRYVVFCKATFPQDLTLDGVRIVVDAAHGAAYRVAPTAFRELGAEVICMGCEPDGSNINVTGALHAEALGRRVVETGAHIGIALDGDADRVIIVDERGHTVDGDAIMALCARQMMAEETLAENTLVTTVMSNLGLERSMEEAGGHLVRTPVGDRHVVARMRRDGLNFGGEQSGHLIFLDRATTGDGVIAALQLLAIAVRTQRPVSELSNEAMERVPQFMVSERFTQRRPLDAMANTTRAVAQLKDRLADAGRVVVRWSGTEPKLRVMVEGEDEGAITTWAHEVVQAARLDLAS